jgi:hypothetical protein
MTLDDYLKETIAFIEENTKDDVTVESVEFIQQLNNDKNVRQSITCFFKQGEVLSNFTAHIFDRRRHLEPLKFLHIKILEDLERLKIRKRVKTDKTLTL